MEQQLNGRPLRFVDARNAVFLALVACGCIDAQLFVDAVIDATMAPSAFAAKHAMTLPIELIHTLVGGVASYAAGVVLARLVRSPAAKWCAILGCVFGAGSTLLSVIELANMPAGQDPGAAVMLAALESACVFIAPILGGHRARRGWRPRVARRRDPGCGHD